MKLLSSIKSCLSPVTSWIRFPVFYFDDAEAKDSQGLIIAFGGHSEERARTWAKRILGNGVRKLETRKTWVWSVYQQAKQFSDNCVVIMIETSGVNDWLLKRYRSFKLSMWVQYALDLTPGLEVLQQASFRLRSEIPRQVRKYQLDYVISNDEDELKWFVENMHIPFINGRYQDTAFFSPLEKILDVFRQSDLIFITVEGKKVAGVLLNYENGIASLRYIGILDNNPEYFRQGCIGALYLFAIKRALEKKYECCNFGGSSPFFNDGLTYFKLSFKPYTLPNTYLENHYIRMILTKPVPALENFLHLNGFIYQDHDSASIKTIFLNEHNFDDPKTLKSKIKSLQCGKIKETHIYAAGDIEKIKPFFKENNIENSTIKIRPYHDAFQEP